MIRARLACVLWLAVLMLLNWPASPPRVLYRLPQMHPRQDGVAATARTPAPLAPTTPDSRATPEPSATPEPPTPAPPTAVPLPSDTTLKLAFFYKPPDPPATAADLAHAAGLLILTKKDEGYRDELRAAGYTGPVLQYVVAAEVNGPPKALKATARCDDGFDPWANQVAYQVGDFCANLHQHEDWFLHNGKGQRLYYKQGDRWFYHMNPASEGWRAFALERMRLFLEGDSATPPLGYDGLFLDNVELSTYKARHQMANSDGKIREFRDDAAYREAWLGYLEELSAALRPRWPIWANMITNKGEETPWEPYLPYLDGAMNESFATGYPGGGTPTPEDWNKALTQAEQTLAARKGLLAVGQGEGDELEQFALASFLLVGDGDRAFFRYATDAGYREFRMPPIEDFDLGPPLGPRYQAVDGTWRRDFARGRVIVDPLDRTGTIVPNETAARAP